MTDNIEKHFPDDESYDRLRTAVKEAWHPLDDAFFFKLLESMYERCQAVVDAIKMHNQSC
jgi:hypothetical protein